MFRQTVEMILETEGHVPRSSAHFYIDITESLPVIPPTPSLVTQNNVLILCSRCEDFGPECRFY